MGHLLREVDWGDPEACDWKNPEAMEGAGECRTTRLGESACICNGSAQEGTGSGVYCSSISVGVDVDPGFKVGCLPGEAGWRGPEVVDWKNPEALAGAGYLGMSEGGFVYGCLA